MPPDEAWVLEELKTKSITEVARATDIPLKTLEKWKLEARKQNPESYPKFINKHSFEVKKRVLEELKTKSTTEVARATDIPLKTLEKWKREARKQNPESYPRFINKHSFEVKKRVLEELKTKSTTEVAKATDIPVSTLAYWKLEARKQNPESYPRFITKHSFEVKKRVFEELKTKSTTEVAKATDIPVSTLADWKLKARKQNPESYPKFINKHSFEVKKRVLEELKTKSINEVAKATDIPLNTLEKWKLKARKQNPELYPHLTQKKQCYQKQEVDFNLPGTSYETPSQDNQFQKQNFNGIVKPEPRVSSGLDFSSLVNDKQQFRTSETLAFKIDKSPTSQIQQSQQNISVIVTNPQYQKLEPLDLTMPSTSSGIQHPAQRPFVHSETSVAVSSQTQELKATDDYASANVENQKYYKNLWIEEISNISGSNYEQQQSETEQSEEEFSFN